MKVNYQNSFLRDLKNIKDNSIVLQIKENIDRLIQSSTLKEVDNIKKIRGKNSAFRMGVKKYRIGFYVENNTIILSRVLHRKDIYKYFPK